MIISVYRMALHPLTHIIFTTPHWLHMLYDVHLKDEYAEVQRGG